MLIFSMRVMILRHSVTTYESYRGKFNELSSLVQLLHTQWGKAKESVEKKKEIKERGGYYYCSAARYDIWQVVLNS